MMRTTLLAFDADDTLWINETYFREVEDWFLDAISTRVPRDEAHRVLHEVIVRNLDDYGFGIKSFILSLLDATMEMLRDDAPPAFIAEIIQRGHWMVHRPLELLGGVAETLTELAPHYAMLLVTKGDRLDQERKLARSSLAPFFDHCEVLADKTPQEYSRLFASRGVALENVIMIGNSIKSDILPILELGGRAVYIPFEPVWAHEVVPLPTDNPRLTCLKSIRELVPMLVPW